MLTKDLIQTRKRGTKIYPTFISPDDAHAVQLAEQMIALFQTSKGKTLAEIESNLKAILPEKKQLIKTAKGFNKILMQRCIDVDETVDVQEERWKVLLQAQESRRKYRDLSEFQNSMAQEFGVESEILSERLYADLPQFRRVSSFKTISADDLINLYNVQLVQSLLLFAKSVKVRMHPLTIKQKRTYCHLVKFQRLILEVDESLNEASKEAEFNFTLTGPLSLFEQSSKYGLKFATFFPYVLHAEHWSIEARLKLNQKEYDLNLGSQSCHLKPTRKALNARMPGELTECLERFNTKMQSEGVKASVSEGVFNFGREHYSVADICLSKPKEAEIHIELFHRWHSSQLSKILAISKESLAENYYLGISTKLVKNPRIQKLLANSEWLKDRIFEFKEFPTSKHLISMWEQVKVRDMS